MTEDREKEIVVFYTTYLEGKIDTAGCFRAAVGNEGIRIMLQETIEDIIHDTQRMSEQRRSKGESRVQWPSRKTSTDPGRCDHATRALHRGTDRR